MMDANCMLNHIWVVMVLAGFAYGIITGDLSVMTNSVLEAAGDAVELGITLLGIVAFWCGIMEIAQEAGLLESISRKMWPFIHFLFPDIPEEHESLKAICTNFVANILGLGWAATPAGLKAMEELKNLEEERRNNKKIENCVSIGVNSNIDISGKANTDISEKVSTERKASNEMCTFLLINISSLQLIPVNIIAYRSQYGSNNPTAIVGPAIIATMISTLVAVVFCKIMNTQIHIAQNKKNAKI